MHIVQVCRLYQPHVGGVETHVAEVSRQLVAAGHQVTVITSQHEATVPVHEKIDGISIIRKPVEIGETKWATWNWIWNHQSVFEMADVIQVHDVVWWLVPILPMIEDKLFTTFHGWEGQYPVRWTAKLQRLMWNWLSVGTVHVGDWIREFYWDRPTHITYGGVDETRKKSVQKSKKNPINIVFLGRLNQENDAEKYLKLVEELTARGVSLKMTWIGDGPYAKAAKKLGRVTGFTPQIHTWLSQADLVFASSYLSIWAAQAYSNVVAAFYSHLLKERYLYTFPGSSAMLLANSVDTMADQVMALIKNQPTKQSLEQQAYGIAKLHPWSAVVAMYLKLWSRHD